MPDAAENISPAPSQLSRVLNLQPDFRVGAMILAAAALLAYWPSLGGGFVWDDLVLVLKNPLVTGEKNLGNIWFAGDFSLSTVAMWIEWLLFGKNPFGYRIVNLLLHFCSVLLIWRILTRLDFRVAWLAAIIFALHPMCVASVAWISELKNTLSLPLFLASINFFLKTENNPAATSRKPAADYIISIVCFTLALMAKTSTVMLPALLLLLAWWRRGRIARADLFKTAPHFALALVFGVMTVWFQTHQAIRAVVPQQENLFERLLAAAMAVWFYLWKLLLPVNLNMVYPRWEITSVTAGTILPLLALITVIVAVWMTQRKWPMARAVWFTLVAFIIALFPVLGFFDMYFMVFSRVSDHFVYLPLIVMPPLVASAVFLLKNPRARTLIAVTVLASLAFFTFQRAKVFHSDESLWRDTVDRNPDAWNAHNNLACNLAERGDLEKAMQSFARSLELNPKNASAQRNYAKALVIKRRFNEADQHYRAALELKPDDASTLADHAEALAQDGRLAEAAERYRAALRIKPLAQTRLRLAPLLLATGHAADAAAEFRLVLKEQPVNIEALNNLAWMLATSSDAKLRDGEEAVRLAEQAWKLTQGKEATALGTLAAAFAEAGQFTNAVIASQQAISVAQAAGNVRYAQMSQQLLQLYRTGRPYHERSANDR